MAQLHDRYDDDDDDDDEHTGSRHVARKQYIMYTSCVWR